MTLKVTGIETIEITNPQGLAPAALPVAHKNLPYVGQQQAPHIPWTTPLVPGTSGITNPTQTTGHIWSKPATVGGATKYVCNAGEGDNFIQGMSGRTSDPDKWARNWSGKMG